MALDGTYAGLQASVADWLNRTDITAPITDMIRMAEVQMDRDIRCADMIVATSLVISGNPTALPADFNGMVALELPAGVGAPMTYRKPEGVRALNQSAFQAPGTPQFWTVAGTNVETAPAASGSFTCPMLYYGRIPSLSNSNTTNWLLTKHPDAYLFGALLQAAPYLKDDARIQSWGMLYQKAVSAIIASDARVSFGHGLVVPFRGAAAPPGTDPQPPPPMALAPPQGGQ